MTHPTNPQAWAEANRKARWRETPLPLPGLYPCLTLQANVTLHKATGMGKFVVVVREPTAHDELYRASQELEDWGKTARPALDQIEFLIGQMGSMMNLDGRLYT